MEPPHFFLIMIFLISKHRYYSIIQPSVPAYLIPPLTNFYFPPLWPLYSQSTRNHILLFDLEFFQLVSNTNWYNFTCFEINYPRILFSLNITLNAVQCSISDIKISLYISLFFINCNMYFMSILST